MDYGLLGGLAQGIQSGLQAYQEAPMLKAQKAQSLYQAKIMDPNSAESENLRDIHKGLLNQFQDGLGDNTITDNLSGYEAKQASEQATGLLEKQMYAEAMGARAKIQQGSLNEKLANDAASAGKDMISGKVTVLGRQTNNSMDKALSILHDRSVPLSPEKFHETYQDYNAGISTAGQASDYKIKSSVPENLTIDALDKFIEKYDLAGKIPDLREDPRTKKFVDALEGGINGVKNDIAGFVADDVYDKYQNYKNHTNPQVREVAKQKLKEWAPDYFKEEFPKESGSAGGGLLNLHKQGKASSQKSSTSGRVNVISPDGRKASIPSDQVNEFLSSPEGKGFKVNAP